MAGEYFVVIDIRAETGRLTRPLRRVSKTVWEPRKRSRFLTLQILFGPAASPPFLGLLPSQLDQLGMKPTMTR